MSENSDIACINSLECAGCYPNPHSIHIDANMKMYTWKTNAEPHREPYTDIFISRSSESQGHLRYLDLAMPNQVLALSY